MNEKLYPLDDNEEYLNSLDMTKNYTDEEIRDIYDVVYHRNDPKQIEVVGRETEKFMFGNIFIPKRFMSDEEARKKYLIIRDRKNNYLCFTGRISQEELYKRAFIDAFRSKLKSSNYV